LTGGVSLRVHLWPITHLRLAGGSRLASQSRIPVEHEVRIRGVKKEHTRRVWAYFTYPARLCESITPGQDTHRAFG
jgi:hypothetical protein